MKRLLILFSLLWTFNLFANIDLFKENTVECAIEEVAEVLRNQTQTLKLVVTGELKDNSHWTQLTEAVRAREKFINLDLSKLKGLTKVGGFSGCEKLAAITFSDCTETIDKEAFKGCKSLESVKIPNSVTFIGENAFSECSSLVNTYISDLTAWCNIKLYNASANPLSNGGSLYLNNNLITQLIIPKSVTSIKFGTFYGCKSITSVTIPNSVTSIGRSAFNRCSNLKSVVIPNSVTFIGDNAFNNCSSLISFNVDTNNKNYSSSDDGKILCDRNKTTLLAYPSVTGDVTISDGVTSIGNYAFYSCESLTSVVIPDSVTSIGESAFADCSNLTSVTIPGGVTSIGNYAFERCDGLINVIIGDSVTSIGESAFADCSSLTNITIPDSVTSIGSYAFSGCSFLKSITFADTSTWYYTDNSDYTGGIEIDVTNTSRNVGYFVDNHNNSYLYKQ